MKACAFVDTCECFQYSDKFLSETQCLITEVAMETRDYICDVFGGRLPASRTDDPSLVCAGGSWFKSQHNIKLLPYIDHQYFVKFLGTKYGLHCAILVF